MDDVLNVADDYFTATFDKVGPNDRPVAGGEFVVYKQKSDQTGEKHYLRYAVPPVPGAPVLESYTTNLEEAHIFAADASIKTRGRILIPGLRPVAEEVLPTS